MNAAQSHRAPLSDELKDALRKVQRENYAKYLARAHGQDLEDMLRLHNFATLRLLASPGDSAAREGWTATMKVIKEILERLA